MEQSLDLSKRLPEWPYYWVSYLLCILHHSYRPSVPEHHTKEALVLFKLKRIRNISDEMLTAWRDKQSKGEIGLFTYLSIFTLCWKEVWVDTLLGQSIISSWKNNNNKKTFSLQAITVHAFIPAVCQQCSMSVPFHFTDSFSCQSTRKCAELVILSLCSFLYNPILPKTMCADMCQGKVQITLVIHQAALVAYIIQLTGP